MSPTPPNTAQRIKVHYTSPGGGHYMLFHAVLGSDFGAFVDAVHDICDAMAALLYTGTSFDGAQYAVAGSAIFNPVVWSDIPATSGVSFTAASNAASNFLQWGGRASSSGKRVKLYLLQCVELKNSKMRFASGDNAAMDAVVNELVVESAVVGNVAGEEVVWYSYTNSGQNDYLTGKART